MPAADDYLSRLKERLFLDWEDPIFQGPLFVSETGEARSRLKSLVSAKSEDALLWSVFHAFARLPAQDWLASLLSVCRRPPQAYPSDVTLHFWQQAGLSRPITLDLTVGGGECSLVVTGKATADISSTSTTDEIARCLDAALALAGPHRDPFYVLVSDDFAHEQPDPMIRWLGPRALSTDAPAPVSTQLLYERLMPRYRDDPGFLAARLPHRTSEELARLDGRIGWTTWADLIDGVLDRSAGFSAVQKRLLQDLVNFLRPRRLLHKGS